MIKWRVGLYFVNIHNLIHATANLIREYDLTIEGITPGEGGTPMLFNEIEVKNQSKPKWKLIKKEVNFDSTLLLAYMLL